MSPSPTPDKETSPLPPEHHHRFPADNNPFIAFRRYADAQLSQLLEGFGISKMRDQQSEDEWPPRPRWVKAAEERLRRGEIEQLMREQQQQQQQHQHHGWRRCERQQQQQEYQEQQQESNDSRWGYRSHCGRHHNHRRGIFGRGDQDSTKAEPTAANNTQETSFSSLPSHPVAALSLTSYLLTSTYSPLALEAHSIRPIAHPGAEPLFWRAAFEDLLAHSVGVEKRETARTPVANENGVQWAGITAFTWAKQLAGDAEKQHAREWAPTGWSSLQDIWSAGRPLPAVWKSVFPDAEVPKQAQSAWNHLGPALDEKKGATSHPDTELDMYERFLENIRGAPTRSSGPAQKEDSSRMKDMIRWNGYPFADQFKPAPSISPASAGAADGTAPAPIKGVLATVTTTERTVLPDGRMHTKVSLRRRFEDGHEEHRETVHTSGESQSRGQWTGAGSNADAAAKKQEGKRSGWFWS